MKTSEVSCMFLKQIIPCRSRRSAKKNVAHAPGAPAVRQGRSSQKKPLLRVLHSLTSGFAHGPYLIVRAPMGGGSPSPWRVNWRAATPIIVWVSGGRARFRGFRRNG